MIKQDILNQTLIRLSKEKGFGEHKMMLIKEHLEETLDYIFKPIDGKVKINDPKSVYEFVKPIIAYEEQEHFHLILLNVKNEIIHNKTLFVGTINQTLIHPREIFKEAVRVSAASMVILHNHPSGNTTPSRDDILMTKRIDEMGRQMDIKLIDHIIVSPIGYTSMKSEGMI